MSADTEKLIAELIDATVSLGLARPQDFPALRIVQSHAKKAIADRIAHLKEALAEARELERIGGMLANAAYNLSQRNLPINERESLRSAQEAWDIAVRNYRAAALSSSKQKDGEE